MDEFLQTEATKPRRDMHWVFIGENGIRAGWSALLFLLIFITLEFLLGFLLGHYLRSHMNPKAPVGPGVALLQEVAQLILVLLATAVMAGIEKRRIGVYGYAGNAKIARFFWGLLWGFISISALVGALWKSHLLVFDGSPLNGVVAWKYAAAWALVFIGTALFEESLLRGYLQYTVARGIGFWWAALLLSALFGLIHKGNPGESPVGLFSAGAVGLVFCISLWYTGSLWWAIGFHAAWDWGETYFYGTSDSGMVAKGHLLSEHPTGSLLWTGGATGPEGSLLVVPLLLGIALCMWLWWGLRSRSVPAKSI
jgi:membrane protease YdiL (CAAX protease family)